MEFTKQDISKWYHTSILPAGGTDELNKFMSDTAIARTTVSTDILGQALIGRVVTDENGTAVALNDNVQVADLITTLKQNGYSDLEIVAMASTVDSNGNTLAPGTFYKDLNRALKAYKKYNFNEADILKMHPGHAHIVENSIALKKLRNAEENG